MREDRRKRYDDGFRHEALGLIKAGAGKHFLARRLAMPVQTAEKWIMQYRSNGEDAVMGAKGKRSYDWETKVAAARDHVDNDMTKTEVMAKYAIASVAPLERWCREYRTGGPGALRPKPKGRPRGARSGPKPKPTREQELAEEVAYLRAKVAYLEKVRALRARKSRGASEAPSCDRPQGGAPARPLAESQRVGSVHVLPSPVSSGACDASRPRTADRGGLGQDRQRVRAPADPHVPGPRVRAEGVGQDRARVMRRMGLKCRIRAANPWRKYSSYRGEDGERVPNLLKRDFRADGPFAKLGTDVTEFKVAGAKAYLAPVYDMAGKEIMAWDVSRHPDMEQQKRLLAMLAPKLPAGASPVLHSDMGWRHQHPWWRERLGELGIRQPMSRKGNCLDNAATEQVFGHLKDEFYRDREFDSYERFKAELDDYIIHWNTKRRQIRLGGHTPEEFRRASTVV